MFGFNTNLTMRLRSFCDWVSLRKNQLLRFYDDIAPIIAPSADALANAPTSKYRDYYFMPQFEVGQQELVDVHHYLYLVDMFAMLAIDRSRDRVRVLMYVMFRRRLPRVRMRLVSCGLR